MMFAGTGSDKRTERTVSAQFCTGRLQENQTTVITDKNKMKRFIEKMTTQVSNTTQCEIIFNIRSSLFLHYTQIFKLLHLIHLGM